MSGYLAWAVLAFVAGYLGGRLVGVGIGRRLGHAEAAIAGRVEALERGRCPVCGSGMVDPGRHAIMGKEEREVSHLSRKGPEADGA
jgi:hypothetical protein